MKIIDLLNMISKGEEVPKKIKYDSYFYIYDEENDFIRENSCICLFGDYMGCYLKEALNEEVEIIEDKPMLVWDEEGKVVEVNVRPNFTYKFSADGLTIASVEEPKEIEEINMEWFKQVDMFDPKSVELAIEIMAKQINELVKAVNELKKGK